MKRIIKNSWVSFVRNGWLSTATILVMTLTLFVIGGLILMGVAAQVVLGDLEGKIDIAVYFYPNSSESDIMNIKNSLEALSDVKEVSYISQDAVLAEFKDRHKNDATIINALGELDQNPLEATLNIKAKDPTKLQDVADYLQNKKYPIVDKINYYENQVVIDRLSGILAGVRNSGLAVIFVLAAIAMLVAFNTIRIAIWSAREEINIMRLVGASSWFIRGPFLFEGVMHGIASGGLAAILFYPVLWVVSPKLLVVIPSIDMHVYYQQHLLQFGGILIGVGVVLGVFSSFIAVHRYLRV